MIGIANDSQIVFVGLCKAEPIWYIKYHKEKKFLWWTLREEGFYIESPYEVTKLSKKVDNSFMQDKIYYEKDHVLLEYSNGREEKIYFNSYQDAENFVKREFSSREWRVFE